MEEQDGPIEQILGVPGVLDVSTSLERMDS